MEVHGSSAVEDWCTPPEVLEIVSEAQGGIDTDPCANADSVVPCSTRWTKADDGLSKPWPGFSFSNPEYGRALPIWCAEYRRRANIGSIRRLTALVPSRTDTDWFHRDIVTADALCFWGGRVTFLVPGPDGKLGPVRDKHGNPMPAPFPSLLPFWAPDDYDAVIAWARVMRRHGTVVVRHGAAAGLHPNR